MKYRFALAMAFLQGYYEDEKISRMEYNRIWDVTKGQTLGYLNSTRNEFKGIRW